MLLILLVIFIALVFTYINGFHDTANSIATVTADPGSYYFLTLHSPNQHALLNAIANVTIDLQNSDLYFASSNTTAIECLNCSSVVFRNFTVDYRQLPFTQATITAIGCASRRKPLKKLLNCS